MDAFRVVLLGPGTVAKEHLRGWLLAGAKVVGTAGPEPPNRELRSLIPDVPHFRTVTPSLAKEIDAVDVCTPHHLHFPQLLEMRDWPVSMLLEKPLVTAAEELDSLRNILDKRPYPIVMRTNKRFESHIINFVELARNASCSLAARVIWRQRPEYMARRKWYRLRSISGGGVVLGMGIHYLDVLADLSSDAEIERAVIRSYRCPPNAPDTTSENYAKVQISSSRINTELILSGWTTRRVPDERILVVGGADRFSFNRLSHRDVEDELLREFRYYRTVISRGEFHPRKDVILRAHKLALQVYERTMRISDSK